MSTASPPHSYIGFAETTFNAELAEPAEQYSSLRVLRVLRCTSSLDADLRLEDPALAAFRTSAWLGELVFAEGEAAGAAARRDDHDAVAGGAGGPDHVAQRILDVRARKPELPREARDRSRFMREIGEQILAERHRAPRSVEDECMTPS